MLFGLATAPWVRGTSAQLGDDDRFYSALQELVACAYEESTRIRQKGRCDPLYPANGILQEMQDLLKKI
jgi:hypothetical protein